MILKQEKGKIIIKIEKIEEQEIKSKLQELIIKGLKEIANKNQVILDLGDMGLNESEFKTLINTFHSLSIPIDLIRNTNPITKMISINYGIPIDAPSVINTHNKLNPRTIPTNNKKIETSFLNEPSKSTLNQDILIHRKNIRSGSLLESGKTILLIGNVNPGAEIRSSQNIIVLGKLMGTAHAGYPNNNNSIIFTLKLKNPLIKIANMVAEFDENEIKKQIKSQEISNILFYHDNNLIRMEIIKEQKE
ncbi:MAG: septum site-determining protein MinC [Candidatus Calescibacterium sp.]|nr:septum site-determining protein MinC [Candidatus Calescibacterium sp.]